MTHPRAGIDIVGAETRPDQLLDKKGFLVGATARRDPAQRIAAIGIADSVDAGGGIGQRLFPAHFAPRLVDRLPDHWRMNALLMLGVAPGEAALDAGVATIGLAVLPRHHAHHLLAAHLGAEGAADAAIGACGDDGALGLANFLDRLFLKRRGRAGLHACAARYTFGREKAVRGQSGGNLAAEPAPIDGQRERPLHFVAGAHAARTDDALAGIEVEIGIGRVSRGPKMVLALIAEPHIAQAHGGGLVLQFAIVVGAAGQAIERMVGDVEFHHPAPQLFKLGRLGVNLHALRHRRGARCRRPAHPIDLDQTQATRSELLEIVGRAQLGDRTAGQRGGAHHGRPGRHADFAPVDKAGHLLVGLDLRGAEICLTFIAHGIASPQTRGLPVY